MTSGLRKFHRYFWVLLTIGVSTFLFFSIKSLDFEDKNQANTELDTNRINPLKVQENDLIKVSEYTRVIEVIVKKSLKTSSSIVYAMDEEGKRSEILGQVEAVGIYNFRPKQAFKGIIIYDAIKDVEITKLSL